MVFNQQRYVRKKNVTFCLIYLTLASQAIKKKKPFLTDIWRGFFPKLIGLSSSTQSRILKPTGKNAGLVIGKDKSCIVWNLKLVNAILSNVSVAVKLSLHTNLTRENQCVKFRYTLVISVTVPKTYSSSLYWIQNISNPITLTLSKNQFNNSPKAPLKYLSQFAYR